MNTEKTDILIKAHELFIQKGYENVTLWMIANELNIEPSKIKFYFHDKEAIAVEIFSIINDLIGDLIDTYIDPKVEPLLFYAVYIHFQIHYYLEEESPYHDFFITAIQDNFYLKVLYRFPVKYMQLTLNLYGEELDEDQVHLYRDIVPNAFFRSIILGKQQGQFEDTAFDELPELIFRATFDRFISHTVIDIVLNQSARIGSMIMLETRNTIPDMYFRNYNYKYNYDKIGAK